jgi:hypothetical protein
MKKLFILASIGLLFILNPVIISESTPNINNPPKVEILLPINGSISYSRDIQVSIRCTDDNGLTNFKVDYTNQFGSGGGYSIAWGGPLNTLFYYNTSLSLYSGYNFITAWAYDESGNVGYNVSSIFYNTSNDTYPPSIEFLLPEKGKLVLLSEYSFSIPTNFSIVIGKFNVASFSKDYEAHSKDMELYVDDKLVAEELSASGGVLGMIYWECRTPLFGWHELTVIATDSFNNSASESLNCFVINFI